MASNDETADLLEAAASVFATLDWCQFSVATDARGRPLDHAADPDAAAVCLLGAVHLGAIKTAAEPATVRAAVDTLRDVLSTDDLIGWNRDRAFGEARVRQQLERAARHARRGGWTHVGAVPHIPPTQPVDDALGKAGGRNRGISHRFNAEGRELATSTNGAGPPARRAGLESGL